MADKLAAVTDATFNEEVSGSDSPVVVDFWAEWCTPCRVIGPILEEIASEKEGSLKILKLNVDENPETTTKFGVQSIPTLILFKGGEVEHRIVGAMSKEHLLKELDPHLVTN